MIGALIGCTWIAALCWVLFVAPRVIEAKRDVTRELP